MKGRKEGRKELPWMSDLALPETYLNDWMDGWEVMGGKNGREEGRKERRKEGGNKE
jgi:hypothetical protein